MAFQPEAGHREVDKVNGGLLPNERQAAFIEWLTDPERTESQNAYCARTGVHVTTVMRWKKDPHFIKAWEKALAEKNVNPERTGTIMDALYEKATSGGNDAVKAAELYMRLVDRMTPDKHMVVTQNLSDLADEDVAKLALEQMSDEDLQKVLDARSR